MPIQRLRPENSLLLVIDLQERLMPTIASAARIEANAAILCRAAALLQIPVICTQQYPKGLGGTVDRVRSALPTTAHLVEKTRFSALVEGTRSALRTHHRPTILVCGVEAHVCVLQSVLDLVAGGWSVFYATDAISAGQPDQIDPAFRRMERVGALPTGTLSALYEWAADASHPLFRELLPLAKAVQKSV